jgi:mannose-6-phosphate isomerase
MFVEIDNTPRDYAWGSIHAIADLLGRPASGQPEAELWLGAHPGSPSRIVRAEQAGGARDLAEWISLDSPTVLGGATSFPFLLKVLAAQTALSIQAHPSMSQAKAGFARENDEGIPLDAPHRNYRDASHKPELIFCVSETFDALCGMREAAQASDVIRGFVHQGDAFDLPTDELVTLADFVMENSDDVADVVAMLLEPHSPRAAAIVAQLVAVAGVVAPMSVIEADASTVRLLSAEYPNDPGIAVALLMNRVKLRRGEALYVEHGIMHAYLSGLGIEIMAASDNVLRGGLTSKHIDVPELLSVGVFRPSQPVILDARKLAPGVDLYAPGVPEFELLHVRVTESNPVEVLHIDGPAIALCINGQARIEGSSFGADMRRGSAIFITPDEHSIAVTGGAELFIARPGENATST